MELPVISVIIPVYNVEKYLSECIESVLAQTMADIEVILVDDGSTDSSGEICEKYKRKDERVTVVHQNNQGAAAARNAGVRLAKGQYIGFVDGDDWIAPEMYEKLLKGFLNDDIEIVGSGINIYRDEKNVTEINYADNLQILTGDEICRLLLRRKFSSSCCTKLFRRNIFEHFSFSTEKTNEDFEILFKIFLHIKNVCVMPDSYYYYRRNDTSITSGINSSKIFDLYYNSCKCYEYVKNHKKVLEKDAFYYMIFEGRFFLIKLEEEKKINMYKRQYNDIIKMMRKHWLGILFKLNFPLKEKIYLLYMIFRNKQKG